LGATTAEAHGDELSLEVTKGVLAEIRLRGFGREGMHSLMDTGCGYSQVLPLLVKCLTAEPGALVMIEQPELHLNPALQVRIAEFLVAMSRAGKQLLVETHSEHIVNTVRVLAAEDESGELAVNTCILYVDGASSPPRIVDLLVAGDGTVEGWPHEFFGEALSLTGRLLRAQRLSRDRREVGG
jgi:predicted ATPase